jgi:hypothetical protein
LLRAAFILWLPASVLFALAAGAALGCLKEEELPSPRAVFAADAAGVKAAVARGRK